MIVFIFIFLGTNWQICSNDNKRDGFNNQKRSVWSLAGDTVQSDWTNRAEVRDTLSVWFSVRFLIGQTGISFGSDWATLAQRRQTELPDWIEILDTKKKQSVFTCADYLDYPGDQLRLFPFQQPSSYSIFLVL